MHEPPAPKGDRTAPRGARPSALALPTETLQRFDGELRTVLELIVSSDWPVLKVRTGIEHGRGTPQSLDLFVELVPEQVGAATLRRAFTELGLEAGEFWYREIESRARGDEALSIIPVRLALDRDDPMRTESGAALVEHLARIARSPFVRRLRAATAHPRCLKQSLRALDWPTPDGSPDTTLSGRDIVIGVIDEGCAFAHHEFLVVRGRTYKTRVLRLWDQSRPPSTSEQALGWSAAGVPYGREIAAASLDRVIKKHVRARRVDEPAVYAELGYVLAPPGENATHGTMVMSIAAGDGSALMGERGVAPSADLIFVHLPPVEVDGNDAALGSRIADAAAYVFDRAEALGKLAAVINVSYGGHRGAHDGTNTAELALDALLARKNRAIVVSAGNGFDADCHADVTIAAGSSLDLDWQVPAEDPTGNDGEIWYDGAATVEVTIVAPDGAAHGPFGFGMHPLVRPDGKTVGRIDHTQRDARNGDNVALIALWPTASAFQTGTAAAAPAGTWKLMLTNPGAAAVRAHAWIARDDLGGRGARRQQSRFAREQAHPGCTIGDLASGRRTIAVGAFNVHTGEVCRYSACGRTRASGAGPERQKPEVCAPAEEDAAGRGVLSAASGRAQPRRLNGTSAAAPHVAGLIALVFEFARTQRKVDLDVGTLRNALAGLRGLLPNLYIEADATRPVKQRAVLAELVGRGKVSLARTLGNL